MKTATLIPSSSSSYIFFALATPKGRLVSQFPQQPSLLLIDNGALFHSPIDQLDRLVDTNFSSTVRPTEIHSVHFNNSLYVLLSGNNGAPLCNKILLRITDSLGIVERYSSRDNDYQCGDYHKMIVSHDQKSLLMVVLKPLNVVLVSNRFVIDFT